VGGIRANNSEIHVFVPIDGVPPNTMGWLNSTNSGANFSALTTAPSPNTNLSLTEASSVAGDYLNHFVHIVKAVNGYIWRYYYYSHSLGWNYLKISTNTFDSPILNVGWNNESTIDYNNRHFDVFGIGTDGMVYQNMWDYAVPSWITAMKKTGLNGTLGATLFASVDPGSSSTTDARMRVFVVKTDGTVYQATRTFTARTSYLVLADWVIVPGVSLSGPQLCIRPAAFSNAGVVTVFSIGNNGALYKANFTAP